MKLTKNFNKSEFECKCGCEMPEDVMFEIQKLAAQLQTIRDFVRKPIKLTNAYRCVEHNKAVGGVSNSQHILGKAADIKIDDMETSEVFETINALTEHGHILQGGLGKYNTFTHYDIRKTKSRWDKTIE
tara:strand:- start:1009 stop:1395 length:387 start_codon:yes stop_codon:yes gene_type:complete